MQTITIHPHRNYVAKLYVATLTIFLVFIFPWVFLAFIPELGWTYVAIFLGANMLWLIPTFILIMPYYRSIAYEIKDDQIVVYKGIFTQSTKVVPYRTITNLHKKRDLLDRWFFGIGSVSVQTAGISGQSTPEQALVGLANYDEVMHTVRERLRQFRSSMATMTEVEGPAPDSIMPQLLQETRQIRHLLEQMAGPNG